jgi:hypothetical protein
MGHNPSMHLVLLVEDPDHWHLDRQSARHRLAESLLESLIKRFVSHAGQISGRKICFIIPGDEGSFGRTNGSGERQVHIGGIG